MDWVSCSQLLFLEDCLSRSTSAAFPNYDIFSWGFILMVLNNLRKIPPGSWEKSYPDKTTRLRYHLPTWPCDPKKTRKLKNISLTGFQKRWERRWPPAGLRCWNSFCRRSLYVGKPRMRSSAGRHMKTQTHFAISICSETKPVWLCSEYITGEGQYF